MKTTLLPTLAALAVLAVPVAGQATTLTFTPTADGTVRTFGGDSAVTDGTTIDFFQSGGNIQNVVLEYDLSAIADGSTINSASLDFTLGRFVSNTGGRPAQIDIFAYAGDGVVDVSDYSATGTQVVDTETANGGAKGDVRTFAFSTLTPLSSILTGNLLTLRLETDSFASVQIAALENLTLAAPTLSVSFTAPTTPPSAVPVPASLPLVLLGMGALAGLRRRKPKR